MTAKTVRAIKRLCRDGLAPDEIVTLSRGDALEEKLPLQCTGLRQLEARGLRTVRAYVLESETEAVNRKCALSPREDLVAIRRLAALERAFTTLQLDLFTDVRNLLRGRDRSATCVWTSCDPYTTAAVRVVEGSGQRSNCGRTTDGASTS